MSLSCKNEISHIFTKQTLIKTHPYLCCFPNVQPVSLTGGHGGSGVNLQSVVWSSLIFTLPDTKAKLRVCLCVCCEWNAAYINRLNLTCQTLQTTLKHHRGTDSHQRGRQRERRGRRAGGGERADDSSCRMMLPRLGTPLRRRVLLLCGESLMSACLGRVTQPPGVCVNEGGRQQAASLAWTLLLWLWAWRESTGMKGDLLVLFARDWWTAKNLPVSTLQHWNPPTSSILRIVISIKN